MFSKLRPVVLRRNFSLAAARPSITLPTRLQTLPSIYQPNHTRLFSSNAEHKHPAEPDDDLTQKVVARAMEDPTLAFKVVDALVRNSVFALPPDHLARGSSWKCQEAEQMFGDADKNRDGVIELHELQDWFERHRVLAKQLKEQQAQKEEVIPMPTDRQLVYVFLRKFIPFVGFGLSDTGIMVMTAGALDVTVGVWLSLTTLTAAALGNCMSNFVALWVVGFIESVADKLGIPNPKLTRQQGKLPKVHKIRTAGSTLGMSFGCLGGLAPLFFFGMAYQENEEDSEKKRE